LEALGFIKKWKQENKEEINTIQGFISSPTDVVADNTRNYYEDTQHEIIKSGVVRDCLAGPFTEEEIQFKQTYEVIKNLQSKTSIQEVDRVIRNLKEASRVQFLTRECKDVMLKELRRLELTKKVLDPES